MTKTVKISCHFRVAESQASADLFLPANRTYTLTLDYPLEKDFTFPIKTGNTGLRTLDLVKKIRKIYRQIYREENTYGIWGHEIDDLIIEEIKVNHTKKTISVAVGS